MVVRATILFAIFLAGSVAIARAQRVESVPPRQPLSTFPMSMGEWRGRNEAPLTEQELRVLGADDYLMRTYFGPAEAAGLYVGYWQTQKRGDSVHSPLNCLPGSGWEPVSNRSLTVAVDSQGRRSDIEVNRYVIQKGLDRQLVLYWYQSHGRVIASEYWGKFYLVADAVRLGRSDTAIVRVIAPIRQNTADAEAAAERTAIGFVQRMFPALDEYIPS